jgi:hypothetical protein
MGLLRKILGAPNPELMYDDGNFQGLIWAVDDEDPEIGERAKNLLSKLVHDQEAAEERKNNLEINYYNEAIKLMTKSKVDFGPIQQVLEDEREILIANDERINDMYSEFFKIRPSGELLSKFKDALEKNEKFLIGLELPRRHSMSKCTGYILAEKRIMYFDDALGIKLIEAKLDSITSAKHVGRINKNLQIKTEEALLEIPLSEKSKEMVSYIEEHLPPDVKNLE